MCWFLCINVQVSRQIVKAATEQSCGRVDGAEACAVLPTPTCYLMNAPRSVCVLTATADVSQ